MLRSTRLLCIALLAACFHVFFVREAYAYLDPGTGSLIFQAVVAGFVGTTYLARRYWRQIKAYVARRGDPPPSVESDEDEAENDAGGRA